MTPYEYQKLAQRTECDQESAMNRRQLADSGMRYNAQQERWEQDGLGPQRRAFATRLFHAAGGIAGEGGELLQAIHRWIYYGAPLDEVNLIEELGDVLWYVAEACNALGIDMQIVMQKNIAKLKARYPNRYEDSKAQLQGRNLETELQALCNDNYKKAATDAMAPKQQRSTFEEDTMSSPRYESEFLSPYVGVPPMLRKNKVCPKCKTPLTDRSPRSCPNCGEALE